MSLKFLNEAALCAKNGYHGANFVAASIVAELRRDEALDAYFGGSINECVLGYPECWATKKGNDSILAFKSSHKVFLGVVGLNDIYTRTETK